MARPTNDEIRRFLEDLGLPQVDPSSFFSSTADEILRIAGDAGPLAPTVKFARFFDTDFTTLLNTDQSFNITGANPGQIRVVSKLFIQFITANVDEIRLQWDDLGGLQDTTIWRDFGPFGAGNYIGTNNAASQAWGALGLDNLICHPPEMTFNQQRQLQVRLISGVASVKTVRVKCTVLDYESRTYPGWSL